MVYYGKEREYISPVWIILFFPSFAEAQDYQKKLKKYYQLPQGASSQDYHSGIINVKLKPQHKYAFKGNNQINPKTLRILEDLGFESIEPLVSGKGTRSPLARAGKKPKFDLELYNRFRYNSNMPLEEAINLFYSTGLFEIAEPEYVQI